MAPYIVLVSEITVLGPCACKQVREMSTYTVVDMLAQKMPVITSFVFILYAHIHEQLGSPGY